MRMRDWLTVSAAIVMLSASAAAAQLAGVAFPDAVALDGTELHLNGIALRTYSWLRIHIYVAGLYLEHPSHDAQAILVRQRKSFWLFDSCTTLTQGMPARRGGTDSRRTASRRVIQRL